MTSAALFCDARESLVNEAGDYLLAGLGPERIRAELGEVLIGEAEGRRDPDELTVFKSLGLAVEDLAAAERVYERARAEGLGTAVPF
jgi:ornithine cyclodeaminase